MITSEDVISTLSNSKFKKIQLPGSAKFSQFDCYEAKRREMEVLVSGINSLNQMTDIGEALNSESILEELANQYGAQTLKVADPGSVLGSEKLATATIDYDTYINYQENELVSAPPAIIDLMNGVAPTQRVFLYGLKNPESFYKAVLVANRPDFITKTKQNRVNDIFTFKKEIGISVRDPARAKEYLRISDPAFNPDTISGNLVDKETYVDDALAQATCDFVGRSLIVFDLVGKTFKTYRTGFWTNEKLGDAYTLILYQGAYLPLIHVDTRNLLDGDALATKLVSQFEHTNREQYKFRDLEIMNGANRQVGAGSGSKIRSALNDPYFDPAKMVSKSDMSLDVIQSKMAEATKNALEAKAQQKPGKSKKTKESEPGNSAIAAESSVSETNTVSTGLLSQSDATAFFLNSRDHPPGMGLGLSGNGISVSGTSSTTTKGLATNTGPSNDNLKTAKLVELQEIATGLGIDIMTEGAGGKPKKKTKEQLVTDITASRMICK